MQLNYWFIIIVLLLGAIASVFTGKLTGIAAFTGWIVGIAVFVGAGYTGVSMLAAFFVLGTTATSIGMHKKHHLKLAEENKGNRTAGQVIANGGMAALLGLLTLLFPSHVSLLSVMMAASLASATADTLSSELGNLYGRKYFNILTLKKDSRGLNGVISAEGTLLGIAGSFIIAIVFALGFGWNFTNLFIIVISGTIGNIADSILGASLERKGLLDNNAVNFLNTAIAAIFSMIFYFL